MAAISVLGVVIVQRRVIDASPSFQETQATIQYGDGTSTYPTGGVAPSGLSLALPNQILAVQFLDTQISGGYIPKYNYSTGKVQLFDNTGTEALTSVTPNSAINIIARGY